MTTASAQRRRNHEMLRKRDKEMIPRMLLRAMLALVVCALVIVAYARITDRPLVAAPPEGVAMVAERPIVLSGSMSGAATVRDLDGRIIAEFDGDQGGFIAGVWRVLQRERMKHRVPVDLPVRLVLFEDNRLSLFDDFTGWRAELIGFGIDNYRIFYDLLAAEPIAPAAETAAAD